ncbi:MCP four helix bundle domain-containing protein [Pseudomonas poae]|uniref:MCP four helix bundle domain-containing protein n=1 Tax=Pseudomonas poae TaxID=200451 RepID=UPI003BB1648A
MKISTKLLLSFVLCAFITLGVGALGIKGVIRLASALDLTFSNNLVSVSNTAATLNGLVAHNRGLYRLLDASHGDVAQQDRERVRQDIAAQLKAGLSAYASYRTTPRR